MRGQIKVQSRTTPKVLVWQLEEQNCCLLTLLIIQGEQFWLLGWSLVGGNQEFRNCYIYATSFTHLSGGVKDALYESEVHRKGLSWLYTFQTPDCHIQKAFEATRMKKRGEVVLELSLEAFWPFKREKRSWGVFRDFPLVGRKTYPVGELYLKY